MELAENNLILFLLVVVDAKNRKEAEIRVAEIGFSDPQDGKGPTDRMAATIKGHRTQFINEGNYVTNAMEMKNAILSHGGLPGIRIMMLAVLGNPKLFPQRNRRLMASVN